MKVINVGIVGQGRSGRNIHAAHILKDPAHYKIAAVAELMPERRKRAAREYGCPVYADYRDLFKHRELDLIVNASFSHMHAPITLEILKAGFNVLCEKPIASKARDVDRLIAAGKKAGKVFAIFQQSNYASYFSKVHEIIKSGVFGRIVQVSIAFNGFSRRWDWQTLREYNGGSLLNTGPHPLLQGLCLFGKGMPEVRCFMDRANTFGDAEDHVKLILSGKGHPIIDIEISSCCAYPAPTFNVYGTRGGMKSTQAEAEWKYFILKEASKQKVTKKPLMDEKGLPTYPRETLQWHTGKWPEQVAGAQKGQSGYSPSSAVRSDAVAAFYDMLYKTITTGAPLEVKPEEIRRLVAVIEECQRQNPHIYSRS